MMKVFPRSSHPLFHPNIVGAALSMVALCVTFAGPSVLGDRGVAVELRAPDGSVVGCKVWLLVIGINKYFLWPSLRGQECWAKDNSDKQESHL